MGHLVAGTVTVNPVVAPFLAFFPLPNGPIKGDTGTYTLATQNITTENFVTSRVDHRFSDHDAIHGTYLFDKGQTTGPDAFDGVFLGTFSQRQTASIQESHVFSPTVVNQAPRFSIASASERLSRSHASCTASSASVIDPSMRYATARRCVRCSSNRSARKS